MHPFFSVILPIYNVAPYLERCIQSVLEQDMKDYEIILVNDGSTDNSPEICDRYAQEYAFIKVVHKENGGLSSARNAGFAHASGQYIWWIDSDDWIESGALRHIYNACDSQPDLVKFNFYRFSDKKGRFVTNLEPGNYDAAMMKSVVQEKAFCEAGKFSLSAWSHVYRREFLLAHNLSFVSERVIGSEDYLFNLCAFLKAESLIMIPQLLYVYALRSQSLSQSYQKNLPERYNVMYGYLRDYYQKAGVLEAYEEKICYFYLWHLLRGTCIRNEYFGDNEASIKERRMRVKKFLQHQDTKKSAAKCKGMLKGGKNLIILWSISQAYEAIIYGIYCIWPKLRKGIKNENVYSS